MVASPAGPRGPSAACSGPPPGYAAHGAVADADYLDGLLLAPGSGGSSGGASASGAGAAVRITELPVGRWTEDYKAALHALVAALQRVRGVQRACAP